VSALGQYDRGSAPCPSRQRILLVQSRRELNSGVSLCAGSKNGPPSVASCWDVAGFKHHIMGIEENRGLATWLTTGGVCRRSQAANHGACTCNKRRDLLKVAGQFKFPAEPKQ
jgi:hypothetical protein